MGRDVIFCRDRNSLRYESIRADRSGIVYDDVNLSDLSREEIIHMLDTENISHIRVLYGLVSVAPGVPRIFTTNDVNRILNTTYLSRVPKEITRRVTLVNVEESLKLNVNVNVSVNVDFQLASQTTSVADNNVECNYEVNDSLGETLLNENNNETN